MGITAISFFFFFLIKKSADVKLQPSECLESGKELNLSKQKELNLQRDSCSFFFFLFFFFLVFFWLSMHWETALREKKWELISSLIILFVNE